MIETYPYGTSKDLISKREEIKCNNIIKTQKWLPLIILQKKLIIKEHNPNSPKIPDHFYRFLIIGVSGCGKTNSLFNLISHQPDIDKIYMLEIHMKQNINY